ncbi:hypothetical protein DLJ96_00790 [Actinotalea fermentans ATCC 43279 = JCM 9966 = DSM 3133]|nr:hypothetical protein DLJ96_00790 [Actinotalea fermentans ATCC 43279 = JCM 9966 = DSM 3133]
MATGMAVVLAVTLAPAVGAVAQPTPEGSPSAVPCVGAVDSAVQASVVAAACDREVEVVSERSAWETVFATPEGRTRVETSAVAVRTDVNGAWEAIDTSVVDAGGRLGVVAPALAMSFSDGSVGEPLARIVRDGHELVFDVPFGLTAPVVEGAQVTYPGVFDGVDLVVSVHEDGTGFSEVLRVESSAAAANPALAQLSFPVQTSDGLSVVSDEGGFVAVDGTGEEVFTSPVPLMWDSSADEVAAPAGGTGPVVGAGVLAPGSSGTGGVGSYGAASLFSRSSVPAGVSAGAGAGTADPVRAPRVGDEIAAMPAVVEADAVTITPDPVMIEDPETVWPIYIDPSIDGHLAQWTMIQSGWPTSAGGYRFTGDQGIGLCSPSSSAECSRASVQRLAWSFTFGTVASLRSAEVVSATFSAYGTHSWSCTATGVQAYWVSGVAAATTWSSHTGSWGSMQDQVSIAHKPSCSGAPQRWVEFDVTGQLKATADGGYSSASIGLKATDEGSMAGGWKRYRNDAKLSIVYNRQPNTPTALTTTNPETACVSGAGRPFIRSVTPTLRATLSDPEADNVQGRWDIFRVSDGAVIWGPSWTSAKASGSQHALTVPAGVLAHGGTYRWRVIGADTRGLQGGAGTCEFTVDTSAPPTPQVLPAAGGTAQYPENQISGGIGQAGKFSLGAAGASDVVSYKYSFNSDALNQTVAAGASNAATITYTPNTVGGVTLYVRSVDRAGNTSPTRTYFFRVGFPASAGSWLLNDAPGLVAKDSLVGSEPARPLNHLSVAAADMWTTGRLGGVDKGLLFDSAGDWASSAVPVVRTDGTFAVNAMVRADVVDGQPRAAVSQDGSVASGFGLGVQTGAGCPAGQSPCWAFWMNASDSAAPAPLISTSSIPVEQGQWVSLTGIYDASADTLTVMVCRPSEFDTPEAGASVSFASPPFTSGALQIGRGQLAGAAAQHWRGVVSTVRVHTVVPSASMSSNDCYTQAS